MADPEKTNLHFFITTAENESRLFKEASNSLSTKRFQNVVVLAFWDEGLADEETHASGLRIVRIKNPMRKLRAVGANGLVKLLHPLLLVFALIQYSVSAFILTRKLRPTYISVHNPVLLPVGVAAKWIVDARAIYLPHELEAHRAGMGRFAAFLTKCFERLFLQAYDSIVVVCDPIAQWYRDNYSTASVYVARNVPMAEFITENDSWSNEFRVKFAVPDDRLIFIYQGLIDRSRGIDNLLRVFESISHHAVFMGYGPHAATVEEHHAANVHYQPAVPMDEIVRFTSSADVGLFVVEGHLDLSYAMSLPNKFFEYLHAGIPVIVSANLIYLSALVRDHGLGWVVDGDLATLCGTIDKSQLARFRDNIKLFVAEAVWEREARIFDKVYHHA